LRTAETPFEAFFKRFARPRRQAAAPRPPSARRHQQRTSSSASLRSVLTRSPAARGFFVGATTSTRIPAASAAR
jgi:hypothetical protein